MCAQTTTRRGFAGFDSLEAIQEANRHAGRHFFDPDTLRFFGSRISRAYGLRGVIAGRFFVTTERRGPSPDAPRGASIRCALDGGDVDTVGEFGMFDTPAQAARAIRRAVDVGVRVHEPADGRVDYGCAVWVGDLMIGASPFLSRQSARRVGRQLWASGIARAEAPAVACDGCGGELDAHALDTDAVAGSAFVLRATSHSTNGRQLERFHADAGKVRDLLAQEGADVAKIASRYPDHFDRRLCRECGERADRTGGRS